MLREIEIKILEIDFRKLQQKLRKLGAKKVEECHIHERIFDYPNRSISKRHELFRIRKYGSRTEITYKKNRAKNSKYIEHDEYETTAQDFETTCTILKLAGFEIIRDREKKRTLYKLGKVKFEIDKYPTIPVYLEIEGTKKTIQEALKKIGYSMKDATNMTSSQVLKKYGKNPNFQRFRK